MIRQGDRGLGENVVRGAVNPDGYEVYKPFLGKKSLTPIVKKSSARKRSG